MARDLYEENYKAGFIDNLSGSALIKIKNTPYLLTPIQEKAEGYDAVINLKEPGILMFIQFKVPDKIGNIKAKQISNAFGEDVSRIKYCMPIRKNDNFQQHRNLLCTEQTYMPCLTFYASPRFNTYYTYDIEYRRKCVHKKSVYFSPAEIGTIPSVNSCKIGYLTRSGDAILYTHANRAITHTRRVNAYTYCDVISSAYEKLHENKNNLHENIDEVYEHIINAVLGPNHALAIEEEDLPERPPSGHLNYLMARQPKYTIIDKNSQHYDIKIRILMSVAEFMDATLFVLHPTDKAYQQ